MPINDTPFTGGLSVAVGAFIGGLAGGIGASIGADAVTRRVFD